MKTKNLIKILPILIAILAFSACKKPTEPNPSSGGSGGGGGSPANTSKTVTFHFQANVNGDTDLMSGMIMFTNAAGNLYGVTNLKYLISDIELHETNGNTVKIPGYHFVNINADSTLTYTPATKIPPGNYDSVSMVFGLIPSENISGEYADLNAMSWNWPDMLGGGYHFMQLEGSFKDSANNTESYQTHIGTAREITAMNDTIFHDNHIDIKMAKSFTVSSNFSVYLNMNIAEWYENPNTIDLNQYGQAIMGNYQAQLLFHDNGADVFTVDSVTAN